MRPADGPRLRLFTPVMALGVLSIDAIGVSSWLSIIVAVAAVIALVALVVMNIGAAVRVWLGSSRLHATGMDVSFVMFTWAASCGALADRLGGGVQARGWLVALSAAGFLIGAAAFARAARASGVDRPVEGRWLLIVVAVESIAIEVAAAVRPASVAVPIAASIWLLGLLVYVALMAAIVNRVRLRALLIAGTHPDYWITMGALAISAVAAATLAPAAGGWLGDAVLLAMIVLWACAAALVPILATAELLAFELRRLEHYDPMRWATVFPLGMFALATHDVGADLGLVALKTVSAAFFGLALVVVAAIAAAVARDTRTGSTTDVTVSV